MKHDAIPGGKRRSVNLSIDADVVAAAKASGVNLSQVSEAAIRAALRADREDRFKAENRAAFDYWNGWVERNDLPLARYRLF